MVSNTNWAGCNNIYSEAEKRIRESVVSISNEMELSKAETVSILTYLTHDILSLRENAAPENIGDRII